MEYNSSERLLNDLKQSKVLPVYVLHGEEPFFIDRVVSYMEHHLLAEHEKDFNMAILYGREVEFKQVLDNTRQFPMMSERRLVILKEAQQMRDIDKLLPYLERPSPQTVFVISHRGKKIDGRSKWFKHARASKTTGVFLSEKIKEYKLGQWLAEYLQHRGRKITPQANHLLCEYLGNDLKKLTNEIEKLELNLPEDATIGTAEIDKYIGISKEYNVFELLSALGTRDVSRAFFIADNLAENMQRNPMQMMAPAIFQFFQKVYITKHTGQMSDQQLAGTLRVNPYFVKEYKHAARIYSDDQLESIFEDLDQTDARVKGINNRKTPDRDLLIELVGRILLN